MIMAVCVVVVMIVAGCMFVVMVMIVGMVMIVAMYMVMVGRALEMPVEHGDAHAKYSEAANHA